jgi:hypothetical protein
VSIEDLVTEAVRLVLEDGLSANEAAEKAFTDDDPMIVRSLAIAGLGAAVNKELTRFRTVGSDAIPESESRIGVPRSGRFQHATRPEEAAAYFWLTKPYATADGQVRALLDFTPDDWNHNLARESAIYSGSARRLSLWQLGADLLGSHPQARTTADLPKTKKAELEAVAERALQGGVVAV